jgi:hypothetical protein
MAVYDRIGREYGAIRRADRRIAEPIRRALGDARSVINGEYSPDLGGPAGRGSFWAGGFASDAPRCIPLLIWSTVSALRGVRSSTSGDGMRVTPDLTQIWPRDEARLGRGLFCCANGLSKPWAELCGAQTRS